MGIMRGLDYIYIYIPHGYPWDSTKDCLGVSGI